MYKHFSYSSICEKKKKNVDIGKVDGNIHNRTVERIFVVLHILSGEAAFCKYTGEIEKERARIDICGR